MILTADFGRLFSNIAVFDRKAIDFLAVNTAAANSHE
jgi:hypothetical protein